jgi:hypothetical protein
MKNIKSDIKDAINYVGTPVMGYIMGGLPGAIISYLPDLPYFKAAFDDMTKGVTEDRLTGYKLELRDFSHSLLCCGLVSLISFATPVPDYVGLVWTGHVLIDYFTHNKNKRFFKPFKPLYPYKEVKLP